MRKRTHMQERTAQLMYQQMKARERHQERSMKRVRTFLEEHRQVHLDFPGAKRGISGMLYADKMLEEAGDIGILIGGLLEECWGGSDKEECFYKHKDVDVLIFDTNNNYEGFKGGIDWWFPYSANDSCTRWKNGGGASINYNLALHPCHNQYNSGLYIPTSQDCYKLRAHEMRNVNKTVNELGEKDLEELSHECYMNVGEKISPLVEDAFEGVITSLDTFAKLID
jgi:hypothetical protein